tara:strand:- start:134 stop:358 length:225 start_codon:yes stop_codon:yes gene_type:complete
MKELNKMKRFRFVQFLTGVNCIHHLQYSYGYKLPFLKIGWFYNYGWKKTDKYKFKGRDGNSLKGYHNCTLTGVY